MRKFVGKKRGLKAPEKNVANKQSRRNGRNERKVARSPSPSSSGNSSEESLGSVSSEEIVVHQEPSMYDNLLSTLGSISGSFANIYKRRQREEEGRSDEDEDEDEGEDEGEYEDEDEHGDGDGDEAEAEAEDGHSTSSSLSEEEDEDEEGSDDESDGSHARGNDLLEPTELDDTMEESEEADTEAEDEVSEMDQEGNLDDKGQTAIGASNNTSSFNVHLGRTLSKPEVDDLTKMKWKFKWEVPAVDISLSKWKGTGECFLKEDECSSHCGLKLKLYKHWLEIYKAAGGNDFHSSKQRQFFSLCNSYRGIVHCNKKPFYLKGLEEDSNLMDGYLMHALNHVVRTRDLISRNDAKLGKQGEHTKELILNGEGFLDHGFTRPKVLILLPLASIARLYHRKLSRLLTHNARSANDLDAFFDSEKGQSSDSTVVMMISVHFLCKKFLIIFQVVDHKDRFFDEFGVGEVEDDNNTLSNNIHDSENLKSQKSSKPADFQTLFGGNNNDHFMIGIKFTKGSIKLYSDFYSSDIIVASPLGLVTKIGEAEVEKEKDVDFLSSIEVLIIDHADVIAMQNWSHVNSVVEKLNHIPSKQHGTDVMRIRKWYLDGNAKFYRQTLLLGSFLNPDMNQVFNQLCMNYEGKVKLITEYKGVLPKVLLQVRQVYERFDATSIIDAEDARLDYFAKKVFPKIKDSLQGGTMLFISSYFEFVRIRNFLKSQNASFCMLGEYTKQSDISRARIWFFEGKRKIMLYTERAHFYHRYKIRGIKNLIIYSLPERKEFYPEIVNMLDVSENMNCTVLFSRFDQLRLERIVGSTPAKRLTSSDKSIFVFC